MSTHTAPDESATPTSDEAEATRSSGAEGDARGDVAPRAWDVSHLHRLTADELRHRAAGLDKARLTVEAAADRIEAGDDPHDEAYMLLGIALTGLTVEWTAIDAAEARLRAGRGDAQRFTSA